MKNLIIKPDTLHRGKTNENKPLRASRGRMGTLPPLQSMRREDKSGLGSW